ncbi:MAG TPA: hypothetical protein VMU77_06120 [Acidimicrobiales bacterium]|nr:hypothetical protein [Acidimicrobiales bacterium]
MNNPNQLLEDLARAIARAFRVDPASIDTECDMFDKNGYSIAGRTLDSLELVEMITVVEGVLGREVEGIIESREKLSLRDLSVFFSTID